MLIRLLCTGLYNVMERKNCIYIVYKNEKKPLIEWCKILGLNYTIIKGRIRIGWDVEKAIKTPQIRYYRGQTKNPAYISWEKMKSRYYNKNDPRYSYYGGRGITVCDSWKNS